MGVPSLNDLAVDGTLIATNQPTNIYMCVCMYRDLEAIKVHIFFNKSMIIKICTCKLLVSHNIQYFTLQSI